MKNLKPYNIKTRMQLNVPIDIYNSLVKWSRESNTTPRLVGDLINDILKVVVSVHEIQLKGGGVQTELKTLTEITAEVTKDMPEITEVTVQQELKSFDENLLNIISNQNSKSE